jgi:hypothetical protein
VTLLCPEPLRAMACCVEDALMARGWQVRLETGTAARRFLERSIAEPDGSLRVVCVEEDLHDDVLSRLHRRLDPRERGDLRIVTFRTPRDVVEAVRSPAVGSRVQRQRAAYQHVSTRRARARRTYLAHPTLVEQPLDRGRAIGYGLGGAVAGLAIAIGLVLITGEAEGHPPVRRLEPLSAISTSPDPQAPDAPWADEPVLSSAVGSVEAWRSAPVREGFTPRPTRRSVASPAAPERSEGRTDRPVPEEPARLHTVADLDPLGLSETADGLEPAELEPAALEPDASTLAEPTADAVSSSIGVPGARRSGAPDVALRGAPRVVDPFAELDDEM